MNIKGISRSIQAIRLDSMDPIEGQPEHRTKPSFLEGLRDSIRANGLLNPVQLVKKSDGRHVIVDGHRRIAVLRELGIQTAKAQVWGSGNEGEEETLQLAANLFEFFNGVTRPWQPKEKWLSAICFGPVMGAQTKNAMALAGDWFGWVSHPQDPNRKVPALPKMLGRPGHRQINVRSQSSPTLFKTARSAGIYTWDIELINDPDIQGDQKKWYKKVLEWLVEQNAQRDVGVYMTNRASPKRLRNAIRKGKVCPSHKTQTEE